jgi:hypothetical protein
LPAALLNSNAVDLSYCSPEVKTQVHNMSFGFGVSDILTGLQLCVDINERCCTTANRVGMYEISRLHLIIFSEAI